MSTKTQLLSEVAKLNEQAAVDLAGKTKVVIQAWLDAEAAPVKRSMSGTLRKYRDMEDHYKPSVAYSGRKSVNVGDDVATFLDGFTPAEVLGAAERILGLDTGELVGKYAHLNPGQQRMNGGNRIRAALKRGDITTKDLH